MANVFTEPKMRPYWARLWWDISHIITFRWTAINPYVAAGEGDLKPKNRTAWEDVTHAIKNIWVEYARIKDND